MSTREERLRELELERALYNQQLGDSQDLDVPSDIHRSRPTLLKAAGSSAEKRSLDAARVLSLLNLKLPTSQGQSPPRSASPRSPKRGDDGGSRVKRQLEDRRQQYTKDSTSNLLSEPFSSFKWTSDREEIKSKAGEPKWEDKAMNATSTSTFKHMMDRDTKLHGKYTSSDKTLLVLLDEERSRYAQLERDYHKLLMEVQTLQNSHSQELKYVGRKSESLVRSMEKALQQKSEEVGRVHKELQEWQRKFSHESAEWISANERLELRVQKLQKSATDHQARAAEHERVLQEITRDRTELLDRLSSKEADMRKMMQDLRERDLEALKHKEEQVQVKVQLSHLQSLIGKREEEIKSLKEILNKQKLELEDLHGVRGAYDEARREIDQLARREKSYSEELDKAAQRERKLIAEFEEQSAQKRQYMHELEKYRTRQGMYEQDIERGKELESQLRAELQSYVSRYNEQVKQINDQELQLRRRTTECSRLTQDLTELRTAAGDLRTQNDQRALEIQQLREAESAHRLEKDELMRQHAQDAQELQTVRQEVAQLAQQNTDLSRRVEAEIADKATLKQQTQERLINVAEKISNLQGALNEAQRQLTDFREAELSSRKALRDRDDKIATQERRIIELQTTITGLQSRINGQTYDLESFKSKKKEELLAVHEKFTAAKAAMENEVASLRAQVQQRATHVSHLTEENGRLKNELSSERFRISDVLANESALKRQFAVLQATVAQKDQENQTLLLKQQSLGDHLQALQNEVKIYRTAHMQKNEDLNRLQSNVNELNRKMFERQTSINSYVTADAQSGRTSPNLSADVGDKPTQEALPQPFEIRETRTKDENELGDALSRQMSYPAMAGGSNAYITTSGRQWQASRGGVPRGLLSQDRGRVMSTNSNLGDDWNRFEVFDTPVGTDALAPPQVNSLTQPQGAQERSRLGSVSAIAGF
ncbi:hypothetical protein HDU85_001418 [Gaertneriomyces sp. JEL0708]|nr:hypothetical protein HDU85_001418 [Gaertneriomyces sp. JEL0708]